VTDRAQVAAALLAAQLTHGRLPSPFTARDVYRNEWTGLTEPRVVQGALACLEELGWLRSDAVRTPAGGRPTVRFRINPRLLAGRHERSRSVPPGAARRS
jgi:putative DNA primase/helicase